MDDDPRDDLDTGLDAAPTVEHDERRTHPRYLVCLALDVEAPAHGKHTAILHDASVGGMYFLTRAALEAGDPLHISVRLASKPERVVQEVTGTVKRVDTLPRERADLWRFGVAVEFDEEAQSLEPELQRWAEVLREAWE